MTRRGSVGALEAVCVFLLPLDVFFFPLFLLFYTPLYT